MPNLRILIVGANKFHSLERIYNKYLNEIKNIESYIFDARYLLDSYRQNKFNKILLHTGFKNIYRQIATQLKKEIESKKPDIIWVFKGMEILPEVILDIRRSGIPLINYNTDHPFIFSGRGSGNRNITKSISLYDLHLSYSREVLNQFSEIGVKCNILPFGYELDTITYDAIKSKAISNRICFIGHPDYSRANTLQRLINDRIPITVIGKRWSKYLKKNHNAEILDVPLYNNDYWKALNKYKVNLNLFRPHNLGSHNMRSFEVPAVGSIMLSPYPNDHIDYFNDIEGVYNYSNYDELVESCNNLLKFDDVFLLKQNLRKYTVEHPYTYKARTDLFLQILSKNNLA